MSQAAVTVEKLSKTYFVHKRAPGLRAAFASVFRRRYEEVRAVADLSLAIAPGERVGFLGPNGAGKTTTLKVLAGLLHPTAGTVRVAGFVPERREAAFLKKITLVMGQKQQLIWDLPPSETFTLNRAVYDIPPRQFDETLAELVELLEIAEIVRKPTRQLSLGERMKCELAAALLHRPAVLFLDEPTIGLDVSMQLTVREFIRRYNERFGATVLLTSHYMDDVAALCPRVVVIDRGSLRYDGDLKKLVHTIRPEKRIVVGFSTSVDRRELERFGRVVEQVDGKTVVQVKQPEVNASVAAILGKFPVVDLTIEDPPLEEVMREVFAGGESGSRSGSRSETETETETET